MPTYVTLSNFTDQGIRSIKDTVKRAEAFRKAAKESGVTIKDILWTQGQYDLITIMEVSDEAAATALALNVAKMGNIRGQTLRAFTAAEMEKTLEPIQELVESSESVVIPCLAHDSFRSARCGSPNTALPPIAAAFVIPPISSTPSGPWYRL